MTFAYRNRKKIVLVFCILLCLGSVVSFSVPHFFKKEKKKEQEKAQTLVLKKDTAQEKQQTKEEILFQVDIKGAVHQPGIYSVKEGSRVIDVIRMAGDLLENADTTVLNLSKKVFDEMVIIVYTKEEVKDFKMTKQTEEQAIEKCRDGVNENLSNDACLEPTKETDVTSQKVSINRATKEELLTIPGIGEAKADAIIAYRKEHGGFKQLEELKEVSGIGDALFTQVQENITL